MLKRGARGRKKSHSPDGKGKKKSRERRANTTKGQVPVSQDICPLGRLQLLMFIEPHIIACSSEC